MLILPRELLDRVVRQWPQILDAYMRSPDLPSTDPAADLDADDDAADDSDAKVVSVSSAEQRWRVERRRRALGIDTSLDDVMLSLNSGAKRRAAAWPAPGTLAGPALATTRASAADVADLFGDVPPATGPAMRSEPATSLAGRSPEPLFEPATAISKQLQLLQSALTDNESGSAASALCDLKTRSEA